MVIERVKAVYPTWWVSVSWSVASRTSARPCLAEQPAHVFSISIIPEIARLTMKRLFDFVLAALGLSVAWPIIILIAIAIRMTSKGPAIFVQERVGRNEVVFRCLKFRTMAAGSPNIASHEASGAWITPVGRFLRRTKLDELPQLINVIGGQMSLVGPRPCLPSQAKLIEERRARQVFSIRPGITGAAQVAGIDMSDPVRLANADARYVEGRTFAGDFALLVKTVLGSGSGDAVAK